MSLEELRKAYQSLDDELLKLQTERDKLLELREKEAESEAEKKFGPRLLDLTTRHMVAFTNLTDAADADRLAKALAELPYPEGTVMARLDVKMNPWPDQYSAVRGPDGKPVMVRTGELGVLEVFRHGDAEPENRSRYSRDTYEGSTIVRLLLKNGKKGKKFVYFTPSDIHWVPNEQDPSHDNDPKPKSTIKV